MLQEGLQPPYCRMEVVYLSWIPQMRLAGALLRLFA